MLAALADESNHRYGGRDPAEAKAYAEEALAVARQAGDAATEADALVTLACNAPLVENLEKIQDLLAQARAAANRAQAYRPLLGAAITESDLLEGLGQHEQAAAVAREGIASARSFGLARTSGATLAINLAEPLVSLGRWDEAIEVIERALDLFPPRLRMTSLWRLSADVALARGDLAAAADFAVSIREAMEGTRFKDERHLPLARLDIELRLAGPGRPAEALTAAQDALDQYHLQTSPRYGWPLLVAAARACVAARGARDEQVAAMAAALRDRLRTEAGKLEVRGPAQHAHQLTFAAEMLRAERALAGSARFSRDGRCGRADPGAGPGADAGPGDLRGAWDAAAQAWAAVSEPYPQASALLRAAEAALSGGDHDGGATRLRQAAGLARRLGARPLAGDIDLLARRARVDLSASGTDGGDAAPGTSGVPGAIPGTGGAAGRARGRRDRGTRPVRAHRARVRGAAAGRGRAEQPRDRQRAVHLREDSKRPRVQHPRQARRHQPGRGRRRRAPPAPLRLVPRRLTTAARSVSRWLGDHSFRAVSGPVMRRSSGNVAAMMPREAAIPATMSR